MRRKLLTTYVGTVCVIGLCSGPAFAQDVPQEETPPSPCVVGVSTFAQCFPDRHLAQAIADTLDATVDMPITENGITSLPDLDLHDKKIVNVRGLENLTNLTTLNLSSNEIVDVAGLEKLASLTTLNLANNQITNVKGLENLTKLASLDLSSNEIVDVAGLEKLASLATLNLANNQITKVEGLEKLTKLWSLDLSGNRHSLEVPFTRDGQKNSVTLTTDLDLAPGGFASKYHFGDTPVTYVFSKGDGSTSYLSGLLQPFSTKNTPNSAVKMLNKISTHVDDRGVSVYAELRNGWGITHQRTVDETGTIFHTVTATNLSDKPQTEQFRQAVDTALGTNDYVPVYADGTGGAYITSEDGKSTIYLQPMSGVAQTMAGRWDTDEADVSTQGRTAGEQLVQRMDAAVFYITPEVTVPAGQSYTFSFREALHQSDEKFAGVINYVNNRDDKTQEIVASYNLPDSKTSDREVSISDYPGLPHGYILDPSSTNPTVFTYGATGILTTINVQVIKSNKDDTGTQTDNPGTQDGDTQTDIPVVVDGDTQTDDPGTQDGESQTDIPVVVDGDSQTDDPGVEDGVRPHGDTPAWKPGNVDGVTQTDSIDSNDGVSQTDDPGIHGGVTPNGDNPAAQPGTVDGATQTGHVDSENVDSQTDIPGTEDVDSQTDIPGTEDVDSQTDNPGTSDGVKPHGDSEGVVGKDDQVLHDDGSAGPDEKESHSLLARTGTAGLPAAGLSALLLIAGGVVMTVRRRS